MTSHMNEVQRSKWYPHIFEKQGGEYCNGCGVEPIKFRIQAPYPINMICIKMFYTMKLFIDHIDNNPHHNYISNFQFLCASCNRIKNPTEKSYTSREKTPEMERRDTRESKFRAYIVKRMIADRFTKYDDLVASACEISDLALRTGKDIMWKIVSSEGWYQKFSFEGDDFVCPKDSYEKIMDEIEEERQKQFEKTYRHP